MHVGFAAVVSPAVKGYYPSWTQCATDEPLDAFTNASDPDSFNNTIQSCSYTKVSEDTALKVSWHGNVAVIDCLLCCVRWYLTIDDEECSDPGPIDIALVQDLSSIGEDFVYNLTRPASVVGICHAAGGTTVGTGLHTVELRVGPCEDVGEFGNVPDPSDSVTGLNSVSRFVIEEIPGSEAACPATIVEPRR